MKAEVTGIHPIYTTYYSLLYRGKRFDMHDGASHANLSRFNPRVGSYTTRVDNIHLIQALQAAINEHKTAQECLL